MDALAAFEWPELSTALAALFERTRQGSATTPSSRFDRDILLLACARHLKDSPSFEACAKVLAAEINYLWADTHGAAAVPSTALPRDAPGRYGAYQHAFDTWIRNASALIGRR